MSNRSNNLAEQRICRLLDENSFMEIGSLVTARNTDFNLADEAAIRWCHYRTWSD